MLAQVQGLSFFVVKGHNFLLLATWAALLQKRSLCPIFVLYCCNESQRGGDLTKIHHKAQQPHEVSPHSTALTRWLYHPFSLAKKPSNYLKKCQVLSTQLFVVVDWWKHPLFLDFTMQYSWLKTLLKLEKWLSLLVDFGKVIPLAMNLMHNVLF